MSMALLTRMKRRSGAQGAAVSHLHNKVLPQSGEGKSLPADVRRNFEIRMGHDFSRVRIHADDSAAQSARMVDARAYTHGNHIVFDKDSYSPHTKTGQKLLAHELTHVVQQSKSSANETPAIQRQPKKGEKAEEEEWVPDEDGDLYYTTKAEATKRMEALKKKDEWTDYRVKSFEKNGKTFWRVEMKGKKKKGGEAEEKEKPKAGESKKTEEDKKAPETKEEEKKAEGEKEEPEKAKGEEEKKKPEEEGAKKEEGASGKKVCLTFDDGPQPGTEDVLDVLKAKSAPGAFFLTGQNMKKDPVLQKSLVERMITEGHQIGNHTFTHSPQAVSEYRKEYGDLSDPAKLKKFQDNYDNNKAHFAKLLGSKFPGFDLARLPGSGRFVTVGGKLIFVVATEGMGMAHVTWHFEFGQPNGVFKHLKSFDWQGITDVCAEVAGFPSAKDVILFHDRHWKGQKTKLTSVITKLTAKGFSFGKLDKKGKCV